MACVFESLKEIFITYDGPGNILYIQYTLAAIKVLGKRICVPWWVHQMMTLL